MKANSRFTCSIMAIAFTAVAARAGETPIDISSLMNEPWTFAGPPSAFAILNGSTYPTGSQNFGGVPFMIPTGPNNYWNAAAPAHFGSGTVSLTVPVGIYGVTSVFTLLNTFYGQPGPNTYLSVTFTGSGGATFTQPLVGGVNVRDYNNDGFQNTINNTSTVQVWTNGKGQRLDRQEYVLPAAFATQVLTSMTLTDTGGENVSRAIFSGLTVSSCQAYVTEQIAVTSSKIVDHPYLGLYAQRIALTNVGSTAVRGPLFFILDGLPTGVTLVNRSGDTECFAPLGSRYVVPLPEGSSLAPNTLLLFDLWFSDPSGSGITYAPLTAVSLGGVP